MGTDAGLAIFTPNWNMDAVAKSKMPLLVVDPSDPFSTATGNYKLAYELPVGAPNDLNI